MDSRIGLSTCFLLSALAVWTGCAAGLLESGTDRDFLPFDLAVDFSDPPEREREIDTVEATVKQSELDSELSPPSTIPVSTTAASTTSPANGELPIALADVIRSVHHSYPLLEASLYSRDVAYGGHLSAHGGFDLKVKAASENGPLGFYETYRQSLSLVQPLYSGSEIWGGYRIGRGEFQPWYLERQTNDGGEFKAGMTVPLLKNRTIDERRADLWRTALDMEFVEFDIQAQLIGFVLEATEAYWDWVAAGREYEIARRVLDLADGRAERIRQQVEAGLIDPPELTDNQRLVAERKAKLADARRKREQKGVKLSLYLRDDRGRPILPQPEQLSPFPDPVPVDPGQLADDIQTALSNRPELQVLTTLLEQLDIDLAQAANETQPDVSAVVWGSQDMGAPSSSKRDKSPFELEAGLYVDVPLQRRKARGKLTAVQAKQQQLAAKTRLVQDKIRADVQSAYAALQAAWEQVQQTREAVRLAEELAQRERRSFEAGASDLLKVTLREQYAAESAQKEVEALFLYHTAHAAYRAALALTAIP